MSKNKYQVIEQFVQGKNPNTMCEDMVADLGNFIVLLDGVTGKDKTTFKELTGGRFAAETVMETLTKLPNDIDARNAVDTITKNLSDTIASEAGNVKHPPGTQMAVCSKARKEIWRVGDVHIRVGEEILPTPAPPTDNIATSFRAALLEAYLEEGTTQQELIDNDPSWDLMLPLLARQDVFANRSDGHSLGYGVVNGTFIPNQYILTLNVPSNTEIVLASDGYLTPEGTLKQAENKLALLLKNDPLLIKNYQGFRAAPTNGSFDDRAWVRFFTGS